MLGRVLVQVGSSCDALSNGDEGGHRSPASQAHPRLHLHVLFQLAASKLVDMSSPHAATASASARPF